jgi:hypothetical protein
MCCEIDIPSLSEVLDYDELSELAIMNITDREALESREEPNSPGLLSLIEEDLVNKMIGKSFNILINGKLPEKEQIIRDPYLALGILEISLNCPPEKFMSLLLKLFQEKDNSIRRRGLKILERFKSDYFAFILSEFQDLVLIKPNQEILEAIKVIQRNCKFYNYEVEQQAKLRKAVQPCCLEENRASLGGGGGKTIINQFPNATEVKIFENVQTYHESPPRDPPN